MERSKRIFYILSRIGVSVLFAGAIISIGLAGYFWIHIKPGLGYILGCFLLMLGLEIAMIFISDPIFRVLSVSMHFFWVFAWIIIMDHSLTLFSTKSTGTIALVLSIVHLIVCLLKNREAVLRVLAVLQFLLILGVITVMFTVFGQEPMQTVQKEIPSENGELSIRVTEVSYAYNDYEARVYVHPNYKIDIGLILLEPEGSLVYYTRDPEHVSSVQWESDNQISINHELYERYGDTCEFKSQKETVVSIPQ